MTEAPGSRPWPEEAPAPGEVVVAADGAFADVAATRIAAVARELARRRGETVSLALAGGSTPRPVYAALTGGDVPWERIEVFFGDERAVAPDDPHSNFRMARESLLDRVPVPPERVHRMRAEAAPIDEAAREYAACLPGVLDLVVLGIGVDGHTASLFPGAQTLLSDDAIVAATSPVPPRGRLTVTPRVLERARRLVVLASGADKADPVARALTGPWDPRHCPAQLARRGLWLLDTAAASALPRALLATGVHEGAEE